MTRECGDSRHLADHQQHQPSLTWDQVHSDELYERTSHNFGHQRLSAGLSFDVGGAQFQIGTGGRHSRYGQSDYYGSSYSSGYSSGYEYSPNYNGSNNGYSYNNRYGNNNNYGYDNSSLDNTNYPGGQGLVTDRYGRVLSPQVFSEQSSMGYQYSNYQNNYNDGYQSGFDGNSFRNPDDRYLISVSPDDQDYGPTNNRFDIQYQRHRYGSGDNSYDSGYSQNDRYNNSRQNWNDRYVIDSPAYNDSYSNYGDSRYQANRYNRDDYSQYYDGGQSGYQNRYSQNQYQQYRYPNGRYAEQYDNGYNGYQNDGYYSGGQNSGNDWMRMRSTLQSMLGHSPREFNRNVPEDLGCATVVSAALRQAHGVNIRDTSVNGLENSLRRNGYEAVPIQYAQPGDCIIAHRAGNRHGHAAIYVGDGKVVNNSSAQGRVVVAPVANFASRDYQSVVAYRRV